MADILLLFDDSELDEQAEYSLCIDEELNLEAIPGALGGLEGRMTDPNSPHMAWVSRGLEVAPKRLKAFGAHVAVG
jgi:hypothetical protein